MNDGPVWIVLSNDGGLDVTECGSEPVHAQCSERWAALSKIHFIVTDITVLGKPNGVSQSTT